jgi:hypothetical protein
MLSFFILYIGQIMYYPSVSAYFNIFIINPGTVILAFCFPSHITGYHYTYMNIYKIV